MDARVPVVCDQCQTTESVDCTKCSGAGYVWVTPTANRDDAPFWAVTSTDPPPSMITPLVEDLEVTQ